MVDIPKDLRSAERDFQLKEGLLRAKKHVQKLIEECNDKAAKEKKGNRHG